MLEPILDSVRARLDIVVQDEDRWRRAAAGAPEARDFAGSLRAPGLSIVAEVKRRSPSAGDIDPGLDAGVLAARYETGGAAAISVLTEPSHFGARPGDLEEVRAAVTLPVLRKDFLLHPAQVWQSRAMGADAVLLIAAILGEAELRSLVEEVRRAGMAALVEVHTPLETERAQSAGAGVIGVNNRDLSTFTVDLGTAERIRPLIGGDVVAVAESGVSSSESAGRMAAAGYDAILVGEAAVRSGDPSGFVASLREAT
jgi:indole-3-glycerol phosphate synthase